MDRVRTIGGDVFVFGEGREKMVLGVEEERPGTVGISYDTSTCGRVCVCMFIYVLCCAVLCCDV